MISRPEDLDRSFQYAKERRLIEEVRGELAQRRLCQIFAVYTKKRDVTQRLQDLLRREGIHAEVLTTQIPPERREAWYEDKLKQGMQVCIAHPRLIMTGLDLLAMPTILFYETGYSTHVLRQASRRSWRIGQKQAVRVCYMSYSGTAQERCLRLMGKKMLVSLALEGKLVNHGLTAMEEDDDVLTALARELVTEKGIGECAAAVWKTLKQSRTNAVASHPLAKAETSGPDSLEAPVFVPEICETRPPASGGKLEQLSFCF